MQLAGNRMMRPKLDHLGYGKYKNVVTQVELEEIARKGGITRPSDGKPAKKVAFIQCAGQRDPNHLTYCSAMCCATSLKQAKYVRQDPEAVARFCTRTCVPRAARNTTTRKPRTIRASC